MNPSETPPRDRLRRLADEGDIRGFRAEADQGKHGFGHIAFAEVSLPDARAAAPDAFDTAADAAADAAARRHIIAGALADLSKIGSADVADCRRMPGEEIARPRHVAGAATFFARKAGRRRRETCGGGRTGVKARGGDGGGMMASGSATGAQTGLCAPPLATAFRASNANGCAR